MYANLTLDEMAQLRTLRAKKRGTPEYRDLVRTILSTAKARHRIPPRKRRVTVEIDNVLQDDFGVLKRKKTGELLRSTNSTVYPPKYYVVPKAEVTAKLEALARASGTPVQIATTTKIGPERFGAKVVGDKLAVKLGTAWNSLTANQVLQAFRMKGREIAVGAFCLFDRNAANVAGLAGLRADDNNLYVPVS